MEKVMCPLCGIMVEIDQDGTCMECTEPLVFPAISKAREKKLHGRLISTMPAIVFLDKNDKPRKPTMKEKETFGDIIEK